MPPEIFRGPDLTLVDEEDEEEGGEKEEKRGGGGVEQKKEELTQNLRNLLKLG